MILLISSNIQFLQSEYWLLTTTYHYLYIFLHLLSVGNKEHKEIHCTAKYFSTKKNKHKNSYMWTKCEKHVPHFISTLVLIIFLRKMLGLPMELPIGCRYLYIGKNLDYFSRYKNYVEYNIISTFKLISSFYGLKLTIWKSFFVY